MSNEVEQIKERLGIAEIINEYVKLEKSGVNYKACCPFHNEKTPSFTVNTERDFWYCFGCQEGGDIFTFIQKIEGLEFREALEKLAERANVELPRFNAEGYKKARSQKQKVLDILELTTKIYQQQLIKHPKSSEILGYLKKRGFTKEAIKDFRIGYAPENWREVVRYLLQKDFKLEDIMGTGLIILKNNADSKNPESYYDRFRDRIMFPVIDINGKVIGYSARVAPGGDEKTAKYINSPQSLVYDKSKVLYGLYQSRQSIRQNGYVIVVEGNADVVLSHGIGVKNVVAVSGTAMTDRQVKLLKQRTDKIMLNFDMDGAGQKATWNSIQICLQNDLQVKIILLPEGYKDVGDIVMGDKSDWRKAIAQAKPVMEYYFESIFSEYNVEEIQDKKIIVKELLNVIKNIADPIEQAYWLKKLALRTQTDEHLLTNLIEKVKLDSREENNNSGAKLNKAVVVDEKKGDIQNLKKYSRHSKLQCRLLGLMVSFPDELRQRIEEFKEGDFFSGEMLKVFIIIKKGKQLGEYTERVNECVAKLMYKSEDSGLTEVQIKPVKEWDIVIGELSKLDKKIRLKEIEMSLREAEEKEDEVTIMKLMNELKNLV